MSNRQSALGADFEAGAHGNIARGVGVHLSETNFGFIGELASFAPEKTDKLIASLRKSLDSKDISAAFKIAPNRWFLSGSEALRDAIASKIKADEASLFDLTHGRSSFLITGEKATWVLAKLFPIDFDLTAFPIQSGVATTHHGTFTQIYRAYENTFELYVFRSFARSFWHTLSTASTEVGYVVE
jgi:methylglutamate dehydrogenase subunit D